MGAFEALKNPNEALELFDSQNPKKGAGVSLLRIVHG